MRKFFCLERATIVGVQGASEDKKFAAKPTQGNSNFVAVFGIKVLLFLLLFCQIEATELILYYSPYCPYSRQVITHLQKVQCQVSLKNVVQDPQAKEELKKWGGRLEVPCLMIDGQALYNSDAIIEWLDTHPNNLNPDSFKLSG